MTDTPEPAGRLGVAAAERARPGTGRPGVSNVMRSGPAERRRRKPWPTRVIALLFLGPAMLTLVLLVVYPIIYTAWLSLRSADGSAFVGLSNYAEIFTGPQTRQALTNNIIWVLVAPTVITILGLIFAVLAEKVRMATAFKLILFMPMAISFLAAGVTFRLVYDESPDRGALNAITVAIHDAFLPASLYHGAQPRDEETLVADGSGGFVAVRTVAAGQPVLLPLVGLPADRVPQDAATAGVPAGQAGLSGLVWLDFTPGGGGRTGQVDPAERGLPAMTVEALRDGKVVAAATSDASGRFVFPQLTGDGYRLRLAAGNFAEPFAGVVWLGPTVVTPSIILAYIWIWAGFAMVLIAAGLSAIPRDALEAARVDGATEWQVFRRVTIPLVRPVLVVVLVTLIINVLKVFDLILVLAPDSAQDDATVVALEMYRNSFTNTGLGSALGILLLLFVVPAMLFNVRRLRGESR